MFAGTGAVVAARRDRTGSDAVEAFLALVVRTLLSAPRSTWPQLRAQAIYGSEEDLSRAEKLGLALVMRLILDKSRGG
jgi:hypothetical protein